MCVPPWVASEQATMEAKMAKSRVFCIFNAAESIRSRGMQDKELASFETNEAFCYCCGGGQLIILAPSHLLIDHPSSLTLT